MLVISTAQTHILYIYSSETFQVAQTFINMYLQQQGKFIVEILLLVCWHTRPLTKAAKWATSKVFAARIEYSPCFVFSRFCCTWSKVDVDNMPTVTILPSSTGRIQISLGPLYKIYLKNHFMLMGRWNSLSALCKLACSGKLFSVCVAISLNYLANVRTCADRLIIPFSFRHGIYTVIWQYMWWSNRSHITNKMMLLCTAHSGSPPHCPTSSLCYFRDTNWTTQIAPVA